MAEKYDTNSMPGMFQYSRTAENVKTVPLTDINNSNRLSIHKMEKEVDFG